MASRVAVITGASAGVGRAVARRFAQAGYNLGLIARDEERLAEAAAERAERVLGPIDVWVNNAMVSVFSPFLEMTLDEFRRVTEVTYLGYIYGTYSALKCMKLRDRGTIVQVGSALAYRGIPPGGRSCSPRS